jgi:lysyl endopeptidase
MSIRNLYTLVFFLSFLIPAAVKGQISQGGIPIQIHKLKSNSADNDLVVMPRVDNQLMIKIYSQPDSLQLKPLKFAYSFPVSLTLKNSGKWFTTTEVNVWQLYIRSTGAFSLNLILEQFKLPDHARLFLISTKTGEIKGAYTSDNNTDSQILAIEPVEGDELLVQYEEPVKASFQGQFQIAKVAHDFLGVTYSDHRPLGVSGTCNVNVNCDVANGSEDVRDAVCRIIIEGADICTGTMMNNTSLDGSPYILTANHCINSEKQAQSSIFLFNYEAPYCSIYNVPSIDGDVSRSMSGSSLKASFDSLDFALVRLNTIPPYNYRTFLAGWNMMSIAPTSSYSIHHPVGDIKKVSIDQQSAGSGSFSGSYLANGFWNVKTWEYGVTESGSSGGGLFDQNEYLIGTLTGGSATCVSRKNDYFEKFALSWNYRKETDKQLKFWLDPLDMNAQKLNGMYSGSGETQCKAYTNFKESDTQAAMQITSGLTKKGYWSGSNSAGYTDFAEQFKVSKTADIKKNCEVQGITFGIAKVKINPAYENTSIDIQVYSGTDKPETLLYTESYPIKKFYNDAMNYIAFKTPVKTIGNFFVSYNISKLHPGDTLVVYMANRKSDVTNSFFIKNQSGWKNYNAYNLNGNGSAILAEVITCNIDDPNDIPNFNTDLPEASFFPNPISGTSLLNIQTVDPIECEEEIAVYDLLGKKQNIPITFNGQNKLILNFAGKRPGIYLVNLEAGGRTIVGKLAYIP